MKWVEAVPVAEKSCGSCTLCCKLFEIDWLDRPKPAGKWCHHCKPGQGCSIWQQVPKACADYYCVWRLDPALADEWRPDRARFLLTHASPDSPLVVMVDPAFPDAWRKEPYFSRLRESARDLLKAKGTTLVVFVGAHRTLIFPDGETPIPAGLALHEIVIEARRGPSGTQWSARFPVK
jgi:hypothetical protein